MSIFIIEIFTAIAQIFRHIILLLLLIKVADFHLWQHFQWFRITRKGINNYKSHFYRNLRHHDNWIHKIIIVI